MRASLEKVNSIRQCITVDAPEDAVSTAIKKALDALRKEIEVPGFRKGKVPDNVIVQRFGDKLGTESIKQLVHDTYPDAIKETEAHPISAPEVEPDGKIEKGKPFRYKATFEVYPEVTVKGYEGLKLNREKVHVTDEEVEAELGKLQRQMTQLEPVSEGELGPGMVATVDFKGTAGGQVFKGSEAEDYVVDFGAGDLLQEFEFQIKGMKPKEEREIAFNYPEDHFKKELAGKRGSFRVKLKDLRRKIMPELDDEFAKGIGKFEKLDDLRDDIRKRIADFKELAAKGSLREQAVQALIEKHKDIEVPTTLIEAELGNMVDQLDGYYRARGLSLADAKIDTKEFVKTNIGKATDRARGYLIIAAIARQENIEVADAEIDKRIEEIASANRLSAVKVRQDYEKNNLLGNLHSQLTFEKTLDLVLSRAKISEKKQKSSK